MTQAFLPTYEGRARVATEECQRELIERAKRNPDDFGELYQQYCPMLLDYVYRRTGDTHATEDLVSDVFLVVMRSLPRYRYRGIPLRAWLYRIATNTVNRWTRRQRRWGTRSMNAELLADRNNRSTPGEATDERLQRALIMLPPRYQAVLSLYHMEGLSVKETATIIGCREGTVRSRLTRARDALRKKLQRTEDKP